MTIQRWRSWALRMLGQKEHFLGFAAANVFEIGLGVVEIDGFDDDNDGVVG